MLDTRTFSWHVASELNASLAGADEDTPRNFPPKKQRARNAPRNF